MKSFNTDKVNVIDVSAGCKINFYCFKLLT